MISYTYKLSTITLLLLFITTGYCVAQTDTIYINNQKIACTVKEITPDAVKYTFAGEDVINSIYKNTVQKIAYKNGRTQSFAESTSYKTVAGVMDFGNVTITAVEGEIKGLFKIGDVSAKAKGTTVYSNQERVKERAYKKLKIEAAMFGANIVYLTNQRTEGNKYGGYFTSGSSAETNLTGIAYSNVLPDNATFKKLIGLKTTFTATTQYKLWASDSDVSQNEIKKLFRIVNIYTENGITYVEGELSGEAVKMQLTGFTTDGFSIAYKAKGTAYNYTIKI